VYFGFTCISMLITSDAVVRLARQNPALARGRFDLALPSLCIALLMAGLVNTFVAPFFDVDIEDRIENATEWWGGTMLILVFLVLAWLWRQTGYQAELKIGSG
jgi:cytochrome bd-type quinol oxidase subunit 2